MGPRAAESKTMGPRTAERNLENGPDLGYKLFPRRE